MRKASATPLSFWRTAGGVAGTYLSLRQCRGDNAVVLRSPIRILSFTSGVHSSIVPVQGGGFDVDSFSMPCFLCHACCWY